jgi:hypothetical protein
MNIFDVPPDGLSAFETAALVWFIISAAFILLCGQKGKGNITAYIYFFTDLIAAFFIIAVRHLAG